MAVDERRPLSPEIIVDAAEELFDIDGRDDVSLRQLGERLGVHPTAIYRHFRDKKELLQAIADRTLAGVAVAGQSDKPPIDAAFDLCLALREVLLTRPAAAKVLAQEPTRRANEIALTEQLLGLLRAAGVSDDHAAAAYHALIGYVCGSAIVDYPLAAQDEASRQAAYRRWRADYLGLDATRFPNLVELAPRLYASASHQFEFGLKLMLDALRDTELDQS